MTDSTDLEFEWKASKLEGSVLTLSALFKSPLRVSFRKFDRLTANFTDIWPYLNEKQVTKNWTSEAQTSKIYQQLGPDKFSQQLRDNESLIPDVLTTASII